MDGEGSTAHPVRDRKEEEAEDVEGFVVNQKKKTFFFDRLLMMLSLHSTFTTDWSVA